MEQETEPFIRTLRGYGKREGLESESFGAFPMFQSQHQNLVRRTVAEEVIYRFCYRGDVTRTGDPGSYTRLAELAGFGWKEFLPSVWNLLPWSFLVDYFVNVGDILAAATTCTDGVMWVNKTTRKVRRETRQAKAWLVAPTPNVTSYGGSHGTYVATSEAFTREVATIGFPTPVFRIPGVDSNAWINILALLNGRSNNPSGG
jgi:hypothetical protein